jgi:predicted short-subunit dehydrogenase-like oxidoreductase (DUF2520 family)
MIGAVQSKAGESLKNFVSSFRVTPFANAAENKTAALRDQLKTILAEAL